MPGGDGTGPRGFGPMTGRATGFCAGFGAPGFANLPTGGGCWPRGGKRGGRGFRNWFYRTGLTGWQRAGGYRPGRDDSLAYAGPYCGASMPEANRQQDVNVLKAQAKYLEDALEGIRMQLKELDEKQNGSQGS